MSDRRQVRKGEDADERRSAARSPERREGRDTGPILDLQARAGNRAVAALFGTHPANSTRAPVQRQPGDQSPTAEPANEAGTSAGGTMTIPDPDLAVPLLSVSMQVGGTGQQRGSSGEVVVSIAIKSLDSRITQAVAKGSRFAKITVAVGAQTFTLRDVVFSSFSMGSDVATVSLNYTSIELGAGE